MRLTNCRFVNGFFPSVALHGLTHKITTVITDNVPFRQPTQIEREQVDQVLGHS